MSKEIEKKLPVGQPRLVVLLPCPFCDGGGSKPYVALYDEDAPNRRPWGFVVRCPHCESQGPRYATSEDAEEGWNERPKRERPRLSKRSLICGWRGMAGSDGCIRPLGHEGGHGFSDGSGFQHNV